MYISDKTRFLRKGMLQEGTQYYIKTLLQNQENIHFYGEKVQRLKIVYFKKLNYNLGEISLNIEHSNLKDFCLKFCIFVPCFFNKLLSDVWRLFPGIIFQCCLMKICRKCGLRRWQDMEFFKREVYLKRQKKYSLSCDTAEQNRKAFKPG